MKPTISLPAQPGDVLREISPRYVSYNIEMAEVTGGTFWKEYTPGQIAGTEPFLLPMDPSCREYSPAMLQTIMQSLMQVYPPIPLSNKKLRFLAKQLGPVWVRVSGTWATKTYYDFGSSAPAGRSSGISAPEGFQNVLTRKQWIGVLDFVREVGGKLLVSVANCNGIHRASDPWTPEQARLLFDTSREYGVPISAVEFVNEPNMMAMSGLPDGYTPADYVRDQDLFIRWIRSHYPDVKIVGPCSCNAGTFGMEEGGSAPASLRSLLPFCRTEELLEGAQESLDIFSYHYYNGVSDRLASVLPDAHWSPEQALSKEYLSAAPRCAASYLPLRDRYCPHCPIWVTESGDAGGGGDTWASTYLDVFRTLHELGSFATLTDGVIFHNTLASSDYGFLHRKTFDPRPNYFAVLLWNRLMGTTVYDASSLSRGDTPVFAHSRRDGKPGIAYLVLNPSRTDSLSLSFSSPASCYLLQAESLRAPVMNLNGNPLVLPQEDCLPDLSPEIHPSGPFTLPPASILFAIL
ncbi:MAG: beta-glucuronidase [Candidatus Heritagella sp.]